MARTVPQIGHWMSTVAIQLFHSLLPDSDEVRIIPVTEPLTEAVPLVGPEAAA